MWLNYALLERARGVYVGTVQATVLAERQALLAYQVFPHAWRRGIAKEACAALLRVLRESFAVETVRAHVDTRNAASRALLASLVDTYLGGRVFGASLVALGALIVRALFPRG